MLLAHESGRRLKTAVVGCGNHAYRSVFPCLDYLAVEKVAVCDQDVDRARHYARHFGAGEVYASLAQLIQSGRAEAVLLAVGPGQHPDLACEALAGGLHVWMEKPPAMNVAGVERMLAARDKAAKCVVVGFKKVFMPAVGRMKKFLDEGKFGRIRTITGRFPTEVPPDGAAVLRENKFTDWIGNGVHPLSLLLELGGRPAALTLHRGAAGGGFVIIEFASGAVASLHLATGHARSGPMERYEVVCDNGHMVLENNTRLLVYRGGYPFDYGRGCDFASGGDDVAALVYEPQHTLSTLDNKAIFMQGFVQELDHFVDCALADKPATRGTLEFARQVMACYEAALKSEGRRIEVA